MARDVDFYLAPPRGRGVLTPEMFPRERDGGRRRIDQYLSEARPRVAHLSADPVAPAVDGARDLATDDYVFWQAYDALAKRMLADPASANLTAQGGASWSDAQRTAFADLALAHKAAFEDAIVIDDVGPDEAIAIPSGPVPVITTF